MKEKHKTHHLFICEERVRFEKDGIE